MKSEQDIRKEIEIYESVIKEFCTPDDYDVRERFRAKINALLWVLEEE